MLVHEWYGLSDIGEVRSRNEDAWAALDMQGVFVLADGMGGHPAGDIASTQAVRYICQYMKKRSFNTDSIHDLHKKFYRLIHQTNEHLFSMSLEDSSLLGMGTTICVANVVGNHLLYGHVGDSRLYLLRKGQLKQLTRDHSLLSELRDSGKISAEEEKHFTKKNVLTQAVGTQEIIEPDCDILELQAGDRILICSDGLHGAVAAKRIQEIMDTTSSVKKTVEDLLYSAKRAQTKDNSTAIVIHVKKDHLLR